jgi:predicted membrane protein
MKDMDKRDFFLPIIIITVLVCLVVPTITYILLPLAAIMIYAVNLYFKTYVDQPDLEELRQKKEPVHKNSKLHT